MSNGQEPEGHGSVVMTAVVCIATEWTGRTREDQRVIVNVRFQSGADLCQRAINSLSCEWARLGEFARWWLV